MIFPGSPSKIIPNQNQKLTIQIYSKEEMQKNNTAENEYSSKKRFYIKRSGVYNG